MDIPQFLELTRKEENFYLAPKFITPVLLEYTPLNRDVIQIIEECSRSGDLYERVIQCLETFSSTGGGCTRSLLAILKGNGISEDYAIRMPHGEKGDYDLDNIAHLTMRINVKTCGFDCSHLISNVLPVVLKQYIHDGWFTREEINNILGNLFYYWTSVAWTKPKEKNYGQENRVDLRDIIEILVYEDIECGSYKRINNYCEIEIKNKRQKLH